MKRITIQRKTKPQPIQPTQTEPEEMDETSDYSSSESYAESEPPTEAIRNLHLTKQPKYKPQYRSEPQVAPVRRARPVPPQPVLAPTRQNPTYQQPAPVRKLGRPRSIDYPQPLRQPYGRPKMRFRSHYGLNSEHLDTQSKARFLYRTCFG